MNESAGRDRKAIGVGAILVAAAVAADPRVLGAVLSPDGTVDDGGNRFLIGAFRVLLAASGLLVLSSGPLARRLLRASRSRPRLTALLLGLLAGLALIVTILLGAETALRLASPPEDPRVHPHHQEGMSDEELFAPDPLYGYAPLPSRSVRVRYVAEGDTIYDIRYEFDPSGLRFTPVPDGAEPDRFALFFGGSFCFGEGVNGEETTPAVFTRHAPAYRPYNFGYSGYGPQQTLVRLREGEWDDLVTERTGVAVYLFWDSHIDRAIGSYEVARGFGRHIPYFVERDGVLVRGSFEDAHPLLDRWYDILDGSRFLRRLEIGWPPFRLPSHYDRTARILAAARDAFTERRPGCPFLVVIYPGSKEAGRLVPRLEARGVRVLDYSDLLPLHESPYFIPVDYHPSAAAHEAVGLRLAEDLRTH